MGPWYRSRGIIQLVGVRVHSESLACTNRPPPYTSYRLRMFYMSQAFIEECLREIRGAADVFGSFIRDDVLPGRPAEM